MTFKHIEKLSDALETSILFKFNDLNFMINFLLHSQYLFHDLDMKVEFQIKIFSQFLQFLRILTYLT